MLTQLFRMLPASIHSFSRAQNQFAVAAVAKLIKDSGLPPTVSFLRLRKYGASALQALEPFDNCTKALLVERAKLFALAHENIERERQPRELKLSAARNARDALAKLLQETHVNPELDRAKDEPELLLNLALRRLQSGLPEAEEDLYYESLAQLLALSECYA